MKAIQEELLPRIIEKIDIITPSPEEIEVVRTHGGWTRKTLLKWGVPWLPEEISPPKGWRRELIRRWGRETYPLDPKDRIDVGGLF
jgi:hypothetical protein